MKFNRNTVKSMRLFVKYKPLRVAYYVGIGCIYLFGLAALIHAIRWW